MKIQILTNNPSKDEGIDFDFRCINFDFRRKFLTIIIIK